VFLNNNQFTEREISDWMRDVQDFPSQVITPGRVKWLKSVIDISRRLFSVIALLDPPLGLKAAGIAGSLLGRLPIFGPSPDEVREFLGDLPKMDYAGISSEIAASGAKNMVLRSFVRRKGLWGLAPFIRISGEEYLCDLHEKKLPAVLVFGHNGPILGILAGLYRLNIPVLVVRKEYPVPYPIPPNISYCFTEGKLKGRAVALKLAIDRLRSGGFVLLALWGKGTSKKDAVEFMGRNAYFAPGFAIAARVSGAPVIPVSSRWAKGRKLIDLYFHDPLPRPDCPPDAGDIFDRSLIKEAAQWLETGIRSTPGQTQVKQMHFFLRNHE
jgi:hypothetical protein